ncbi:MAG: 23S rRNA (uracil(1939)-C(5))-methyltransferase RlmD, partial [Acetatifactor sp.]|nr:23S rRNA (uracil(1939)-C(5))-methyltransferase RlmD [Acetatifactor sp.]
QPKCPHHRQCGGCQIQALAYDKQLEYKQQKVKNNLIRIGDFSSDEIEKVMEPIIGMEEPYRYRNKAQYPVGTDREGHVVTGFYAGRTHTIIPSTECYLGAEENREILEILISHMEKYHIPAYNEETGKGQVRHILIRKGFTTGEIMVCVVINGGYSKKGTEYIPYQAEFISKLSEIKGITSVSVSVNPEKTNVIMGKEIYTIWGSPVIHDVIHVRDMQKEGYPCTGQELTFAISPLSFYQVNPVQTEKLYSLTLEYAGLTGQEVLWDLYCGIGTISLFLASGARQVCGVEIIPQAIEDARANARRNEIMNAVFYTGKAEEVLESEFCKEEDLRHPDVIVVDPPRKGCDRACLDTMLQMQPDRIVYVSCDSATLARDLRILCDGGYKLKRVRAVDQFGHTVHVECIVLLTRNISIFRG